MPPMGGSSWSQPSETKSTNVSVNVSSTSTTLNYTVYGASKCDCTFEWKNVGGGQTGYMEARDGDTLYYHQFPKIVPQDVINQLRKGGKEKRGNYIMFTFTHPPGVSLEPYVR